TFTQATLEPRSKHRVCRAWVRTHDDDHVGKHDGVECLFRSRFAQGHFGPIAGRRMTDAGACVDVVGAECGPHQFLYQIGFFVGAARGCQTADRVAAVLGLNSLELGSRVLNGFIPADFTPGLVDAASDHRLGDAVLVGCVAPGKTALDTGVPAIGLAVFPGHHAHHLIAFHFGLERTAYSAVRAGGNDGVLGLTHLDHRLFDEGRGGACLHACPTRHAVAFQERVVLAGCHARCEPPTVDGKCKGALDFVAGAYAAAAHNAFSGVVIEI